MSKKKIDDVSALSDNALDSTSEPLADEKDIDPSVILDKEVLGVYKPYILTFPTRVFKNGRFISVEPRDCTSFINFQPSFTEQIHSLSLAEQIKRGQGQAQDYTEQEKMNYYDFPDGRDDGRAPVGLYELSEPAYAYEREAEFKRVVGSDLKAQVLQQQADKAMKSASKSSVSASEESVEQFSAPQSTFTSTDSK